MDEAPQSTSPPIYRSQAFAVPMQPRAPRGVAPSGSKTYETVGDRRSVPAGLLSKALFPRARRVGLNGGFSQTPGLAG